MQNNSEFDALFEGKNHIATLPDIFYKLRQVMDDPEKTYHDIGDVILQDPGLTARILKIANSPYYSLPNKIETVSQALGIIGLDEINDLVLSTLIVDKFKGMSNKAISMPSFWEHSLCCGFASKEIASLISDISKERIFIGGLLHNIGLLVLCLKVPGKVQKIVDVCINDNLYFNESERIILGFDHSMVGEHLLKLWKLPAIFQQIARYHHVPLTARTFNTEVSVVHLADNLVRSHGIGSTVEISLPDIEKETLHTLGLNMNLLEEIFRKRILPKFKEASGAFLEAA